MADLEWSRIVGSKTLYDGGYVGDLMTVGMAHIEEAKRRGEITQTEAGQMYSALIPSAIKEGISFEQTKQSIELDISTKKLNRK